MHLQYKDRLLHLTLKKDSKGIKSFLNDLPKTVKGNVFEQYLAELYRGNGWLIEAKGGRGDQGVDILLYHPKTPSRVSLIIQAKNHAIPLTFDQTKIELVKFEEQAASKYNCQQFNLVSVNGFAEDAEKLSQFNMLLYEWDYVADLINRYDPDCMIEPEIELYAHNQLTYEKCKELWKRSNYVAVVQATGTGKSYLIAKVMADHLDQKKLVMAPSNYILEQQRSEVPWASNSTNFMTYAKAANLTENEIKNLNAKLIVLDEFHRCGAEVWGAGVQRILKTYAESYVFGTTATPIRYLDANRDMSDELFDSVVAEDLSLAEAIVRRILPPPKYVAALYTLQEEIADLIKTLENSKKSDEEKKEIGAEINKIKLDWEKTSGVPQILKKHLRPEINKFIIFCKDQMHLDQMEVEVQRWFRKAGTHRWRRVFRVLSADPESNKNLEDFKTSKSKDTAHLLFAIDMLNEGLHISDVGAVILLRPTESPRIFYQQIGRCIQVNVENAPIIFDLVNNFQNLRADDFLEDLEEAREAEKERRADLGLEEYSPEIFIMDETKEILEVCESISKQLLPWDVMFKHLCDYSEREDHARVPASYITEDGFNLGQWVWLQRKVYKRNKLTKSRIELLENLPGWSWDPHEEQWMIGYEHLKEYAEREGHAKVLRGYVGADAYSIGKWADKNRARYRNNKLSEHRIELLEALPGWSWHPLKDRWKEGFAQLKEYVACNGNSMVPQNFITANSFNLGSWVTAQRSAYRKNMLQENRIKLLVELPGWSWDTLDDKWTQGYEHLKRYAEREGHSRVSARFLTEDDFKLGSWLVIQRVAYKNNKLSEDRTKLLEELSGWSWDPFKDKWMIGYEYLKEYAEREGHTRVPVSYINSYDFKLGVWVDHQRGRYKKNKLHENYINLLEVLPSWTWDPHEDLWMIGYENLEDYADRVGHAKVAQSYITENGFGLGSWVSRNRADYKNHKLSEDRIKLLEELPGWSWDTIEDQWKDGFEQLKRYLEREGHTKVPYDFETAGGFKLGHWSYRQRKRHKQNKLLEDRIKLLKEIGFDWKIDTK